MGQAREGHHRHRQRRRATRRRPHRGARRRPPRARRSTRRARPARCSCSLPTSRKSCRSCTCVSATRWRSAASRVVELSPTATSMTPLAAASLRYRPGEQAALAASLVSGDAPRRGDRRGLVLRRHRHRGARRPSVGRRVVERDRGGRRVPSPGSAPTRASSSPPVAGTCAAPSTWGWRPGCFRGESHSTRVAIRSPSTGVRCLPPAAWMPPQSSAPLPTAPSGA